MKQAGFGVAGASGLAASVFLTLKAILIDSGSIRGMRQTLEVAGEKELSELGKYYALLKAERSHLRHLISQLDWELLGETQCRVERERDNRHLRRRVDGLNDIIDRERERARERVEELERRILRLRVAHLGEILARAHR